MQLKTCYRETKGFSRPKFDQNRKSRKKRQNQILGVGNSIRLRARSRIELASSKSPEQ